jgi:hypothetical protein
MAFINRIDAGGLALRQFVGQLGHPIGRRGWRQN